VNLGLTGYVDINIIAFVSRASGKNPEKKSARICDTNVSFSTTLHVRDHCLCLHVQRAARALARRFDDALRPANLTNGQFSMLMSLNRPEPVSMSSVANLLAMDRTTLTAALKPLERRGLIKVAANPADRRARLLTLTASGKDLLAQAVPIWQVTHSELERNLPTGDADELRKSLVALL
jgi:DNA-binding MarR family transcriptional regulator